MMCPRRVRTASMATRGRRYAVPMSVTIRRKSRPFPFRRIRRSRAAARNRRISETLLFVGAVRVTRIARIFFWHQIQHHALRKSFHAPPAAHVCQTFQIVRLHVRYFDHGRRRKHVPGTSCTGVFRVVLTAISSNLRY